MHLIIGTYTERLPHVHGKADGIGAASFDPASGRLGEVRALAAARNPSYLAVTPSGDRLYAVCESDMFEGNRGGGLAAFERDTRTGELTRLNARSTVGDWPCHVALARGGRFVVTANYGTDGGSVTVYPVRADGGLGDLADHVRHPGSGPNAERQASSHAHMIASDPSTGDLLVADLGADTIFGYEVSGTGGLSLKRELRTRPGAGPRHLAFHPDGRHLFVVNELDGTVSVWRRDAGGSGDRGGSGDPGDSWDPGGFAEVAAVSTIPAGAAIPPHAGGGNLPAAVRVSPSGRHVLVSNRGHDSIAVFRFDPPASGLRLLGVVPAEGECPRDFVLTPDGRWLIAASQDGDLLASYAFDDVAGTLRLLHRATAPTPACLALA
ncbi:MAG: lactonase family protein [Nocardiopsaceae bacterium]|nr:lactonase family protein [Nocardiopsaceae bacterium]